MSQLSASAVPQVPAPQGKAPRPTAVTAPAPPKPAPPPRELDSIGPRKLIRPTLPARMQRGRRFTRHDEPALSLHAAAPAHPGPVTVRESSHAESFYFQKQLQAQTPMVFVLDDGEKIEGAIEWYDRNVIKVRCTATSSPRSRGPRAAEGVTRMLIYKSCIKYLYKAGENHP